MSLWNSTEFNTNPACFQVGPTEPASVPYRTAQFAVFVTFVVLMLITSLGFLYMRQYRRRLRIRSPLPIFLSSFGGMVLILLRTSYDFVGREYFPCSLNLVAFYLLVPFIILPDMVSSAAFLAKQYRRHMLNANTLQAIEKKVKEFADQDERTHATVVEYLKGLWDFNLTVASLSWCGTVDNRMWYHPVRKPSVLREASYELITVTLLAIPFYVALILRTTLVPQWNLANGCTGCIVEWQDIVITSIFVAVYAIPTAILVFRLVSANIPDPLFSMLDTKRSVIVVVPLFSAWVILLPTDPNGLMRAQLVDWHVFEMVAIIVLHIVRTSFQLFRTRRLHKLGEKNVNLIDILADGKGSLLFEKHLIGELANENLLFWREAIKYKLQFDRNNDFEYSQQMAKVLWRTFLSPHASLPINISDSVKRTIDARFKGTVGKTVFDEALAEVYLMMQNGAFQRFIHSPAFKEYASTKADFSMSTVFNPMSIVPSMAEDGVSTPIHMDIKDYIRSFPASSSIGRADVM